MTHKGVLTFLEIFLVEFLTSSSKGSLASILEKENRPGFYLEQIFRSESLTVTQSQSQPSE